MISFNSNFEAIKKKKNLSQENQDLSEQDQQTQAPDISTYLFQCQSENGILLQIQKSLYLKCTQFYQGLVQNKKINKFILTGQTNQDGMNSKDISNSNSEIKEKSIYHPSKPLFISRNIDPSQSINQFTNRSKPDTSNGRLQNFSAPKVDLDLFTRRSNVSPDQKQEFYECYSSRHNEGSLQKQLLRNYSELTSRKNKSQQLQQPSSSNLSSQANLNLLQAFQNQQIKPFMPKKQSFLYTSDSEFQTILKLSHNLNSKNNLSEGQNYQLQFMKSPSTQDKSLNKINQSQLNLRFQQAEQPIYDKIAQHEGHINQFQNQRILQQNFENVKNSYIESNTTLNKQSAYTSLEQSTTWIDHQKGFPQQLQQQKEFPSKMSQQKQISTNQTNPSQSNYTFDYNNNNFMSNSTKKQNGLYHQVAKSIDFSGSESLRLRSSINYQYYQNQQSHPNLLSQQTLQPSQKEQEQNEYQMNKQSRKRQNSDITQVNVEQNSNNQENNNFYNRNLSRTKTEVKDEQVKYTYKVPSNFKQEFPKIQALDDINDFQNKTATFKRIQLNNSNLNASKNQLSERQSRYINPSSQSVKVFIKQNNQKTSLRNSQEIQKEDNSNNTNKQNKQTQQQQLFTFYNKPLFSSKS